MFNNLAIDNISLAKCSVQAHRFPPRESSVPGIQYYARAITVEAPAAGVLVAADVAVAAGGSQAHAAAVAPQAGITEQGLVDRAEGTPAWKRGRISVDT